METGEGIGAPPNFVNSLQTWLKSVFGKRFHNRGNVLPHAVQDDHYSCGIIALNTPERGVGLQNFTYAPAWEELCHIIQIHSPRAYGALKEYLPMPDKRSLR